MKKSWGNPIVQVMFVPQEYIAGCDVIKSTSSFIFWSWPTDYYLDLNNNGRYVDTNYSNDRGEHFDRNGQSESGSRVDGVYRDVVAYSRVGLFDRYAGQINSFTKVTVKNGIAYNAS